LAGRFGVQPFYFAARAWRRWRFHHSMGPVTAMNGSARLKMQAAMRAGQPKMSPDGQAPLSAR